MSEPCYRVCSLKSLSGHCQLTAGCIYRGLQKLPQYKVEDMIPIKTVAEHLKKRIVGEDKCLECHQSDNNLNCTECWEKEIRSWKNKDMQNWSEKKKDEERAKTKL